MPLPPLDQRSRDNLTNELEKLKNTYDACADIFGSARSVNAKKALDAISTAQLAIHDELQSRTT